jgi:hypothetical protein
MYGLDIFHTNVCVNAHKKCAYMRTSSEIDVAVHDDDGEVLDDVRFMTPFWRNN